MVRALVQYGFRDRGTRKRRTITFSHSDKIESFDPAEEAGYENWLTQGSIEVVVYAGGHLTTPDDIAVLVRTRLASIIGNIL